MTTTLLTIDFESDIVTVTVHVEPEATYEYGREASDFQTIVDFVNSQHETNFHMPLGPLSISPEGHIVLHRGGVTTRKITLDENGQVWPYAFGKESEINHV